MCIYNTFVLFDPRVRAHIRATYIRSCAVELDCACMDAFYSRRESHCRSTAHNYSYAIHQLVFMVKACVLTARYVYLHAHTYKRRPCKEFTYVEKRGEVASEKIRTEHYRIHTRTTNKIERSQ